MLHTFSAGGKSKENKAAQKPIQSPGIKSKESITPAYVAWRVGTSNTVVVSVLASLKVLQIQIFVACPSKDNVYKDYWPCPPWSLAWLEAEGNICDTTNRRRVQERQYYYTTLLNSRVYTLADMVIVAGLSCTEAEFMNNFVEVSGHNLESSQTQCCGFGSGYVSTTLIRIRIKVISWIRWASTPILQAILSSLVEE